MTTKRRVINIVAGVLKYAVLIFGAIVFRKKSKFFAEEV